MADFRRESNRGDGHSASEHHLALAQDNDQTFRAWLHTGVLLVVLGFAALELAGEPQVGLPIGAAFALIVVASGIVLLVIGRLRFARHRDQNAAERFRPADRAIAVATTLALVIGLASLAMVWLLRASER